MKSVEFHTIDHQPGFNAAKSYENISTQLIAGDINPITITVNKGNSREDSDQSRVQIWADWDVDGTFENHELLVSKVVENSDYDPNGNYRFSENIIVPLNTSPTHPIPLRIMGHFIDPFKPTSGNNACDAIYSGNAATYLLNIMPPDEERVLADFSLPTKKVNKGESVVFTDQSSSTLNTSITNWYWNFPGGNPATSTQQNPNVSYEIPGVHDVTLIVTNLDKSLTDTISKKQAVTVFFNYCEPNIEYTRFFNVTRVQFNTINHQPRKSQATEYPNINTSLVAGENYHITVSTNKGFAGEYERNRVQIWADWDVDGTFENHELLVSKVVENTNYDPNGDYRFNENIIVPINISPAHPIPLRIMGHYINYFKPTSGNNACDTIYSGNAATYLLNIMPPDEERVLADFSLPIKKVNKGEIVVFTDQSSSTLNTSITNWYWNFPGGSPATSTQQNPNVSYEIPGVHDVTLIVTNLDKSLTDTITKKQAVAVFFNYCEPNIEYTRFFNVTRVQFNTINHQPRKSQATEYPHINTSLVAGENYHITVSTNKGFAGEYERNRVQIWADWDVDGSFENHELLVSKVVENSNYDPNGDYRFNENIIVPINISPAHPIPLRIMGHYINYFKPTSGNNACDTIYSGNAATYLLNIMPPDEERVLADFSLPTKKINKGEFILFTDQSLSTFNTSITNWYWNFPGGSPATSTQQNPNVSYEIPGVHDVTLIVTNLDKSLTDTITKKQAVTVFFNYCEPSIEYTHLLNITRVQFNTINHQPRKGQTTEYPNINTSLVAYQEYPISITVNKGFSGEYERNRVQIWADWDVDGSFENHELLVSKVVENSDYDPNGDYRFNENIIVPINISPTHPIPLRIMGHYINYFKPTSGNNACDTIYAGNAATYLLNIMPPDEERVLADFSAPKKVNKGEIVVFTDQSSSTYNTSITNWYWNFPGGNPATSTQQNPNISYEIPGAHDVTLIVTNLDKSLTDTIIKKQVITVFFNYCEPNIESTRFFNVTRVQFNTINHQPRKGQATEYPNINTSLVAGENYHITVSVNKGFSGENDQNRVQIWADWDVDGTFENHELLVSKVVENSDYDPNGDYRFNENIIVPINISPTHPIPLRIMGHYIRDNQENNACDTINSGNAATYLLNIMPPDEERVLADFSLPTKKVNKGESVVFTDQSSSTFNTSITNWYWNFPGGNPATSTQQSPNVSYEIPGAHDVTLIVTNQNKSLTDTITKKQAVTVFFNYCEPNFNVTRVQFNTIDHQPRKGQATEYPNINTSLVAGENYPITVSVNKGFTGENDQNRVQIWADWDVDGTFENHELLVSKVVENSDYDPNGDYRFNENIIVPINISPTHPIPLRIMGHYIRDNQENNACDTIDSGNAATYLLNIMPPDEERVLADFSLPTKKVNKGEGIVFTDQSSSTFNTSITNWYWNFPGGNPATSTQQNPNVSYEIPGVYDVTLIVTNLDKSLTDTIIKKQVITVFFNYCEPNIINTNFFNVTRVQFNTIDHQPRKGQATEYPNINTSLVADQEYPISITVNKGNGGKNDQNRVQIWADWDVDGTFENHERLVSKVVENTNYDPNGDYRFNENIIVPINISPAHPIPLRIMGHYINYFKPTSGNNACDTIDSGNAATYLLNIMPPDEERVLADFSLPTKKVNKGEIVVFTDQSSSTLNTSITNWYWNFPGGNPATSTQQNPNVSYEIPGVYDVTLIVTNLDKSLTDTITKKQAVTVFFNYCEPNIEYTEYFNVTRVQFNTIDHQPRKYQATEYPNINTSLVADQEYPISITVNKGNDSEYDQNRVQIWADWDVDGTFENHELLVSKVVENTNYDPNGDYRFNENIIVPINISPTHPIPLRIMGHYIGDNQGNNACDTIETGNAATYLLNIMPPDEERVLADFSLPTKKVNKGESVVFTDQSSSTFNTSITNWYWNFPGGNPATSTQQNPNISYEIPGVHDVTLIVTNLDKILTDTITKKQAVTVFFNYCEPNFNVTRVQFNTINHQPRKYQATEYPNINTSLVADQEYPISITVNKGNGSEYDQNRVQIWADWDVNGTFENHELLVSKVVENSDYDPNGNYRFNENIIVPLNVSPAHPIPLRIMGHYIGDNQGNNACDTIYAGNAATYLLNIMPPPDEERVLADFSLPIKKVNKGESVVFTDQSSSTLNTSITNWYWNFSGGNPATSTQQNPNVSYEIPGVYDVTLIVTNLDKSLTDTITKKQAVTVFFNYCEPNIINTNFFNVTRVQFNTINHQPRKGQATEYPNINTSLVAGENYHITVSANKGNGGEYERNRVQIWADWDVDGSFENHELLVSKVVENSDYDANGDYRFNENIIVPINISPAHPIPLRIMGHYINYFKPTSGNNACDTIYAGNAATYLLNIMPPDEERVLADFSLPTKKVNKGEGVVFTDQSSSTFNTSITNWYWNFSGGNPATSTQQNPNVSYEIPGVYDVTLIVTNLDKSLTDTIIKKQVITVFFNYCEPNFNVTRVQFNTIDHQPRKGQATEYPNINTSLVAGENYPITVSANKGNMGEYERNRVQIWADWDVDGSFENHELLVSKVVENSDYDPNGDYRFNENIIVPINISPAYPIPLRIMGHYIGDNQGNNACDTIETGNAATYLIIISTEPDEEKVLADFSLPTKKVNKGESIVFTDQSSSTFNTSITNWYWNFTGGNPATSTQQNPNVSYEIPGVYDVTLIVTNLDKSLTDTIIKKQAVTVFFNYCEPNIINTNFFNVTRVQFNTINHQPRKGQATEYPNINTSLVAGENYHITVSANKGNGGEYERNRVQIWADWDVDGSFENHELLVSKVVENSDYDANGDYRFNENIIVPINISPAHPIPLRIMGHLIDRTKPTSGNNACDTIYAGNAATYLLNIMPPDEERVLADFSLPTKKVNKGEGVVFTDQSSSTFNTSITNWYWNFSGGNPATSTQQNPNVSYEIPGVYDVTLIVTNLDKSLTDTIIKKQVITVFFNYCEPNFNVTRVQFNTIDHQPRKGQATEYPNINTSLVAGENYPITVSANKGNMGEYERNRVQIWADWDVDGSFENHELLVSKVVENSDYDPNGDYRFNENIIVPINISPAYPIPLRIMGHYIGDNQGNNACDTIETGNAATYLLNIMPPPDEEKVLADFSLPTKKVNKGESVVVIDQSSSTYNTSITNWYWNFPGGNPATSTQQNPSVSYEIPGVHDVTLIVTNLDKSLTDTIIKKQVTTVFFNYCEPNIINTNFFNVTRVQFNTIDHQPRKGQATEYPNINTSLVADQEYPISITVNKGNGSEYDRNRVQIWADWDVDGSFENHERLLSKVVENTNYDPNGDYRFNENIIVPINISPTHPIPLRIIGHYIRDNQGNNACDTIETGNAATYLLNIMPPDEERVLADFSLPTKKVNKGESVVFTDQSSSTFNTSITNWYWNFPGGNPATSTQQNPNVSYEIPGVHDVTLIVTNLDKSLTDTITKKQAVTVFFNYCEPNFNVTRVQFNTIDHQPRKGQATEYPNINTSLVADQEYPISITVNKGNGSEYDQNRVQIWADWDVDGTFENYELLVSKVVENTNYDPNGDYRFNENIIVPINISPAHPIPLRIMGHYIGDNQGNNACDTIETGNAATYLIIISTEPEPTEKPLGIYHRKQVDIMLYPNPSSGIFKLKLKNNINIDQINFLNISGKRIYPKIIQQNDSTIMIDMTGFSQGMYFIQIYNDKNIHIEKIIIK